MRSESLTRRKQLEKRQLGEENSRMRIKLLEIANEKKVIHQQVKLCQAKKKMQQLLKHQQNLMENLILLKKITNVSPSVSHRIQIQDHNHFSKMKQMDRYFQDDDRSFIRLTHNNQTPMNTNQTKTLDVQHLRLSELRLFSNGQLIQ